MSTAYQRSKDASAKRKARIRELELSRSQGALTEAELTEWNEVVAAEKKWEDRLKKGRERAKKWQKDNPGKAKAAQDKFKEKNPEKLKLYQKRVLDKDPDYHKKVGRKYRAANPEKARAAGQKGAAKYRAENPELARAMSRRTGVKKKLKEMPGHKNAEKWKSQLEQLEKDIKGYRAKIKTTKKPSGTLKKGGAAVVLGGAAYLGSKLFKSKGDATDDRKYLKDKSLWR